MKFKAGLIDRTKSILSILNKNIQSNISKLLGPEKIPDSFKFKIQSLDNKWINMKTSILTKANSDDTKTYYENAIILSINIFNN